MTTDLFIAAAQRITEEHMRLQREAERVAFNQGVDRASEVISEWLAEGRDQVDLFDRLADIKKWLR